MKFLHFFNSRQGEIIRLLKQLVNLESPTQQKSAVDKCGQFCAETLQRAGAIITKYKQDKTGDNYLAEFGSSSDNNQEKSILVLTHSDTVWPIGQIKKMPIYIQENKMFGPGILDMKAGLTMIIYILQSFRQLNISPKRKISLFINSAEETGSAGSEEILKKLGKKAAFGFCLEPAIPGGALKLQRKGRVVIRLEIKGKASHAGSPESGINAIDELMAQLKDIYSLRSNNISVSTGVVQGGVKPNIVAEEAFSKIDIRFWNSTQKETILRHFKTLSPTVKGARISYKIEHNTLPMEKTQASLNLFNKVKKIAESMDINLEAGKTGGGSDASLISNLGIPILDGLGPDGAGIHAQNEHLILPSLIERTALLAEVLQHLY